MRPRRPGDMKVLQETALATDEEAIAPTIRLDGELIESKRLEWECVQILCTLVFVFVLTRLVSIAVKSAAIFGYQVLPLDCSGSSP
jgi:hypothetical protein